LYSTVDLVPNYDSRDFPGQIVLLTLCYPSREGIEAFGIRDVVDKDNGVDISVVVLDHGLSEPLLTRRVPELKL
jgi:hypothetical protein